MLVSTTDLEETFILFFSVHLQIEGVGCFEVFLPLCPTTRRHSRGDCVRNYHRPENIKSHNLYDPLYVYCANQGTAADTFRWQYQESHGL